MNSSLRIIVADDEPDIRRYFARALEKLGHQVVGAVANGDELVKASRDQRPDLIVTDIVMPVMDGFAAISTIHEERLIPVIIISSHDLADEAQASRCDDLVTYLMKPVSISDLDKAISELHKKVSQVASQK